MKHLSVIQYYCYPNQHTPAEVYNQMDDEVEKLLLEATAEFILNVRLKMNHPFHQWSNHQKAWDFVLKNSL
jgi:hypothetical protein